jgi:hypothetical protein
VEPFAQHLADHLGVPVRALTTEAWNTPRGTVMLDEKMFQVDGAGEVTEVDRIGEWRDFLPRPMEDAP